MKALGLVLVVAGSFAGGLATSGDAEAQLAGGGEETGWVGAGSATEVRVEIDPRIELMTVVQLLTDYPVLTRFDMPYRRDMEAYFSPFSESRAVMLFDSMVATGFAFDAVPRALMAMSPPPDLMLAGRVPEEILSRAGGRERLERFARALHDFARATDLASFYRAHRGTYEAAVEAALPHVQEGFAQLGDHVGTPFTDARVVLSPLLHDGGFAMFGGEPAAQGFIGPEGVTGGLPDFGRGDRIGPLVWHEFAHTVVNPLTASMSATVDSLEVDDADFMATMAGQAYGDWPTIVKESVIRAIQVRLATLILGQAAGEAALQDQLKRGFVRVPLLAEALPTYEAERASYSALSDFYPRLLDVFREPLPVPAESAGRAR